MEGLSWNTIFNNPRDVIISIPEGMPTAFQIATVIPSAFMTFLLKWNILSTRDSLYRSNQTFTAEKPPEHLHVQSCEESDLLPSFLFLLLISADQQWQPINNHLENCTVLSRPDLIENSVNYLIGNEEKRPRQNFKAIMMNGGREHWLECETSCGSIREIYTGDSKS